MTATPTWKANIATASKVGVDSSVTTPDEPADSPAASATPAKAPAKKRAGAKVAPPKAPPVQAPQRATIERVKVPKVQSNVRIPIELDEAMVDEINSDAERGVRRTKEAIVTEALTAYYHLRAPRR